jgi:hypothetical protein
MRLEYSARSLADLRQIAADSRTAFGDIVAAALESRIRAVLAQMPVCVPEGTVTV